MRSKLYIYQRVLPHYRHEFFELLASRIDATGLDFELIYGLEKSGTVPCTKKINAVWANVNKNIYVNILGVEVVFQFSPLPRRNSFVVVEQSNRLVFNYILLLLKSVGWCHVAYWGHGRNHQSGSPAGLREKFKRSISTWVDWWFAYTDDTGRYVESLGYPAEKITSVMNSINTRSLSAELKLLKEHVSCSKMDGEVQRGIYCGGMYPEKRLDFLFTVLDEIKARCSGFEFVFIGSGPDAEKVKIFCFDRDWCEYVGPITDLTRVKYFLDSDVFLMPGLVGLAVLDSFALETPMITTDIEMHSPEIEYLKDGVNGLISKNDIDDYVDVVVSVFEDKSKLASLKAGCRCSAEAYTVENMASRFHDGVVKWVGERF